MLVCSAQTLDHGHGFEEIHELTEMCFVLDQIIWHMLVNVMFGLQI